MPHVTANGVRLFHDLTGPAGAPVLVLSNSIGATLEMWDAVLPALAGRYQVLRYDTRGHGRSETPAGPATIDDLADDLLGLLDALGFARAHIAGLSLGGMTAQFLAARHPGSIISLTLMATSAHLPGNWEERATAVVANGMASIADAVMARWLTPAFAAAHPAQAAALRDRFVAQDPHGYAACCRAIAAMDLRAAIAAIAAPTLILAGADDPATPVPMMEDIRTRIPGAELVVIPRAAHILSVERPDAVTRHLGAFLDSFSDASQRAPDTFNAGLANRKAVLGVEHVQRSIDGATAFSMPWQDFITRMAWDEIWGDPAIPWKTRSMVTLAMMVALGREEEFKLHLRPALRNGVSVAELRALLMQTAIYAGVPAANGAFRWAQAVLGDELDGVAPT